MTSTERARLRRRRHVLAVAPVLLAGLTSCAANQPAPKTPAQLTEHDVVKLRALDPQPRKTAKPRARVVKPPPRPAKIGTALTIRHLRVTEYCFEGSPTSLGKPPWIGVAAVKKASGIPYGAHLVIAGKRYVVGDREPSFGVSDVDLYAGEGPACERAAAVWGIRVLPVGIERAAA